MSLTKIKKSNIELNVQLPHANAAYDTANAASSYANSAFDAANNATDSWVRDAANSSSSYANGSFSTANSALVNSILADQRAVTSGDYANSAYGQANTSSQQSITSGDYANSAFGVANSKATTTYVDDAVANLVNSAPETLNTLNELAAALGDDPNFATTIANTIGTTGGYANSSFAQSNTNATNITVVGDYANSAFSVANASLNAETGGSITGDIDITGNLTVTGCTASLTVTTLRTSDHIIDVGHGTTGVPTQNAGLRVVRGDENPVQLRWVESDDFWEYTNDGSNYIKFGAESDGIYANAAFQSANSSGDYANSAFSAANNAVDTWVRDAANSGSSYANSSYIHANAAFEAANAGGAGTDDWARDAANSAGVYANAAFSTANTGGGGGGSTVTVDSAPPASGNVSGDVWIDSGDGTEYTWIEDADSSQWVELGPFTPPSNTSIINANNTTVTGNVLPQTTETYNLGSSDKKWKDLYLSGNTIFLGNTTISASNNNLVLPANTKVGDSNTTLPAGGAFMFRNKLINGNFDVWQRGTSQTSDGFGSADRWGCFNVGSTKTASQQAFALGQTDVPNNPRYFMRHAVTSVAGASNYAIKDQKIEGVETLAGQTATLSFWAKADASKNIAIEFRQYFGTGGSPSAAVEGIESRLVALTTSWAKYTITVNIPSVSGKTLGTNSNDYLQFFFWFDAGSNWNSRSASLGQQSGTFDIAQVQIEEGSAATPFEMRPIGTEFSLCERYYQVVPLNAFNSSTQTYSAPFYMSSPMRTNPTGTITGGSSVSVTTRGLENVINKGGRFTIIGSAGSSYSIGASGLMDAEL